MRSIPKLWVLCSGSALDAVEQGKPAVIKALALRPQFLSNNGPF